MGLISTVLPLVTEPLPIIWSYAMRKNGYWQIATNAQRFFWEWLLLEGVCCVFQPKPQFFSSVLRELAVLGCNIHVKENSERWKKIEQSKNTISKALSYFS